MKRGTVRHACIGFALVGIVGVVLGGCSLSSSPQSSASSSPATAQSSPSPTITGGASPAASGPAAVVDQYWRSLQAGDCATAYGLTVDPARAKYISVSNLCKSIQLDSVRSYQVGDVTSQSATSAMVKVTVVRGSGTRMTPTVVTTLVGSSWKISDFIT